MSNLIQIDQLSKNYRNVLALSDVSFHMKEGEILGLLGANGAGKTTLISILTTLETPNEGKAFIFGQDVSENSHDMKSGVGFVPQEIISHGFFTVEEVLKFSSGYQGIKGNADRISYLLDRLDLAPHKDKKVADLSGGMKRRFMIVKALIHRPRLLLLDEPTAGVDIELRIKLWRFVEELNKEGLSILLTTHYLEEAENLCDRLVILQKGKVVQTGPTKDLIQNQTSRTVTVEFNKPQSHLKHKYLFELNDYGAIFKIPYDMPINVLLNDINLERGVLRDLKIREGRLEDVLMGVLDE